MGRQPLLIVTLALVAIGAASSEFRFLDGRIVGGEDTTIENHPYQISLLYYNSHRCGGSIISEYWIVTAAHCVNTISTSVSDALQIRVASSTRNSGGTLHSISYWTYHPSYSDYTYDYDIAVIKLQLPLEFGAAVQPIELAPANYTIADGTVLSVSGWGRLSSGGALPVQLQVVEVPKINNTFCGQLYSYLLPVTDRMICAGITEAGGRDACQGDSGGPLFYGNILVGVVSWGDGCAQAYQPGVYSSVSVLRDWVLEQTGLNEVL